MRSEAYLTITIMAVAGLWFVWDLGIKKLFLDDFRERLFDLRFKLFEMGEADELPFDSEAYRAVETILCGLLRFGHRLTFMGFVFSALEEIKSKKTNEYVDYQKQIELKISRTSPATQERLWAILSELHKTVTVYIARSSLLFMASALVFAFLRTLNLFRNIGKREISAVLEREAYRAESRRHVRHAAIA
jgi:hypothetical protein